MAAEIRGVARLGHDQRGASMRPRRMAAEIACYSEFLETVFAVLQ